MLQAISVKYFSVLRGDKGLYHVLKEHYSIYQHSRVVFEKSCSLWVYLPHQHTLLFPSVYIEQCKSRVLAY